MENIKLIMLKDYIHSLENLLIFMCQTYIDQEKILFKLAKEGNEALFEVPRIQGSSNIVHLSQLAEMEFEKPKQGFKEVKETIKENRTSRNINAK